jgi:hypothetical protein
VSGVSAAAKLDAVSIVAKNRPERMHHPKAAGGLFEFNWQFIKQTEARINL